MYCVLLVSGVVRTVTRTTTAADCAGSASLPTGNPSNGTLLLTEPSDVPTNPLWLSTDDGLAVSGAIASLWVLAWAIRQVRRSTD